MNELNLFEPIEQRVHIAQKTIKDRPSDKLSDAFISLLAGAHGLVEINTRLRADAALQRAFGRSRCAEQSVVQDTLNACTAEQLERRRKAFQIEGAKGFFQRQPALAQQAFCAPLMAKRFFPLR